MSLNVDTDVVLLVDAENTFISINQKVMLHNFKFISPIIATYTINCYAIPSRLFLSVEEIYFLVTEQLKITQQP